MIIASSSPGKGGNKDTGGTDKLEPLVAGSSLPLQTQLELLGRLLVRYPGIIGSLAVGLSWFLHINALPMHWSQHDAMLGLKCALPILALDAALMLPDWSPPTTTKVIKIKAPKAVAEKLRQQQEGEAAEGQAESAVLGATQPLGIITAVQEVIQSTAQVPTGSSNSSFGVSEASSSEGAAAPTRASPPDEELVEIERTITVRGDQAPIAAALHRLQMEKAGSNVARMLSFPLELLLMLTWHLAEEMLYRAVILTWAAGWTIDRLYEAGADETVSLLGTTLATPQAGALFAAVGCTAASLAILVQQALFPLRIINAAEAELEAKEAASGAGPAVRQERARMRRVLAKVKNGMVRQRRWATAVEGARDVAEWAAYSTSFLLTGNLLAPYVTAVSADLLFSGYQRVKAGQLQRAQAQAQRTLQELHNTATTLRQARKSVLQPPPVVAPKLESRGGGDLQAGSHGGGTGDGVGRAPGAEQRERGSEGGAGEGNAAVDASHSASDHK